MDVGHVIPFGRSDLRQETRLQDVANEALASRDDRPLLHLVRRRRPGRASCRYPLFLSSHMLDPCLPILIRHACGNTLAPQHFLYFFPLPQGQASLRPTLSDCIGMGDSAFAVCDWINAGSEEAASFVTMLTGSFKAYAGIIAEQQAFGIAAQAVFEAPP